MFRKYLLIFTLALISCAGTKLIHSKTTKVAIGEEQKWMGEDLQNDDDLVRAEEASARKKVVRLM